MEKYHKILLPLPVELWEAVKREAAADRRPLTVWIQIIIEQYLKEKK